VARREAPDNADHADTLGWAYYKTGNYVLALDQLRFAVSRRPESPVFLYHLGMACWKRDQRNEAKVSLKRALDTDKGFKERSLAEAALKELAKGTAEKLGS
jgi:uncharacterized protein HemY